MKENALKEQAKADLAKTAGEACPCASGQMDPKLHEFAHLFGQGLSDRQILTRMGITYEEAHRMANELRKQFGVAPGGSLRDAIRSRHAGRHP